MHNEQPSFRQQLDKSVHYVSNYVSQKPKLAMILGSGLGSFAEKLENKIKISTSQIPFYPESTVEGHEGYLVFGNFENIPVLAVQGRTHFYEGHTIQEVAYVVHIMAELGVQSLLVTNAAGGLNLRFKPGDLMIITDHINFMFRNPLRGPVIKDMARWPDMYNAYHPDYISKIEKVGLDLKIPLRKGVLFASSGPTYETRAEVEMARRLGADAVSMSTVPEVLVARSRGITVAGLSCITNLATGISPTPLSHAEVTEIAARVRSKFQRIVEGFILKSAEK